MPIGPKELQAPYIDFKYGFTLSWALNFDLKNLQYYKFHPEIIPFFEDRFNIIENKINTYLSNCF
ncbi:hypothetical protein P344_05630 [Spiroplasma mirum ATCC 29335]|uniref:Uncharacterized protein n=1 Tax=Spiroplasma mirum ATCC 29335 TaxID=838561 RepID=W6AXH1_9MOLU|nr:MULTISPECIES: hypothetical protein [Spiroplasma]AHI58444.1 hypothetical protein P344_05630 [Spiroplasma mirum ATCC 29335]AKM53383.1 hypothetical protein SATRI_v1c10130 [Spiroplasma atrichopogonis]